MAQKWSSSTRFFVSFHHSFLLLAIFKSRFCKRVMCGRGGHNKVVFVFLFFHSQACCLIVARQAAMSSIPFSSKIRQKRRGKVNKRALCLTLTFCQEKESFPETPHQTHFYISPSKSASSVYL